MSRSCVNATGVCLQGTAASTKNKLPTLITSMETIGAKALEEFADSIKVSHRLVSRCSDTRRCFCFSSCNIFWVQCAVFPMQS